jgi:tetratricopeptide (TPR) repeat protein
MRLIARRLIRALDVSLFFSGFCSASLNINTMKVMTNCRKVSFLVIAGLFFMVASCRSHSNVEEPANDKQSAAAYIAQADQLYAQREDILRMRQGVALLRQAHAADPGSYEAAWRLAKFNYYLATHTDGDERDKAFREGIEAGKAATRLQGNRPEGHFWLGAVYGGSLEKGTVAGLATVEDVRNEMQAVLRLDEGYQDGSAYMVLGLVDLKAPKLLGGDLQKAVEEMEKGLRFGENNAFLRLHLAEAYQAVGRSKDARQQLNLIIHMTPDPNYLPEYKEAMAEARQLLEKIGNSTKGTNSR